MKIEVWSDVACPFCYIGKKKLESALSSFESKEQVEVVWKSYQLDPQIADSSQNAIDYLSLKKGIPSNKVLEMMAGVRQMASSEGLIMHPEKAIVANSFDAHRLSHLANKYGVQNEMEELLFEAYFKEGKNISDKKILLALADKAGIDHKEAQNVLNSYLYTSDVEDDIREGNALGVRGVPFFVFNRTYAISGAQDAQVFENTLKRSFKEWNEKVITK